MKIPKDIIIISWICFVVAGFLYYREWQFLNRAETAIGVVKTYRISDL